MKIAFTGHRPNKLNNDYEFTSPLMQWIKSQIQDYVANLIYPKPNEEHLIITGMALGIDTLAAQIAIEMNIPFMAAIPFKGQESKWPMRSQHTYLHLLQQAKIISVCDIERTMTYEEYIKLEKGMYLSSKFQKRNEFMVDTCDTLIAVWDETPGGTANCITYAQKMNIENKYFSNDNIIFINPKNFELTISK